MGHAPEPLFIYEGDDYVPPAEDERPEDVARY